jgi:hypothetical protein
MEDLRRPRVLTTAGKNRSLEKTCEKVPYISSLDCVTRAITLDTSMNRRNVIDVRLV